MAYRNYSTTRTHDPTTCALCQIELDDDTEDTGLPAALVAICLCLLTIGAMSLVAVYLPSLAAWWAGR